MSGFPQVAAVNRRNEFAICRSVAYLFQQELTPHNMADQNIEITAYLKTFCGWSEGVRSVFRKYGLEWEEKDIIKNPAFRWEMEQKSGQPLSPCVVVNGTMLADVSGEEVEAWMIENDLLAKSEEAPDAPIDSACTDEQHAAMEAEARANMAGGASPNVRIIE